MGIVVQPPPLARAHWVYPPAEAEANYYRNKKTQELSQAETA